MGTNLSGMQWASPGLRVNSDSLPNLHFTVPRRADVAYLAANGFTRNRLPVRWEMLQPMLHDTQANAGTRAAIGQPGAFHAGYESYITGVLDAHAAVGAKCVIQLHNSCRYVDFRFQLDGSVIGLVEPADPLTYPYTTDATQVQVRIFALAAGATLWPSNFADVWTRAAMKWKDHPGFGGYGLMNEPYQMPGPGSIVESPDGGNQDFMIWPAFAQAAIKAIRALDPTGTIYLGGNEWSSAMALASANPAWPLPPDNNLIYEVHMYLDAASNGANFDYDTEVAKNFSAGLGAVPIGPDTGRNRIQMAIDWAQAKGVRLALTETGMPVDDPRWQVMFQRALDTARQGVCEIQSWQGGSHWPMHNLGMTHVPGWHQNKTLEASMAGPMKKTAGISKAELFDDGPGWAPSGTPITVTVYARGNLSSPVNLQVTSSNGGTLSKTQVTIPAGANGQDTFTFTPAPNTVATLTYTSTAASLAPPPRKIYSLADPVAYAATSLSDAAMAILAKYGACKWELADGYTDYLLGSPAGEGQPVRAISDSGYGSSPGNAMEMLNWVNTDSSNMGAMSVPVMRVANGRKSSDHSVPGTCGFWCRKSIPVAGVQPNPRNRVPYNIEDPHFAIAAVSLPGLDHTGVLFEASNAEKEYCSELSFSNSRPQARWTDAAGNVVTLSSPFPLPVNVPAVVSFTSAADAQRLRVNSDVVASASATFTAGAYDQLLLGWGFRNYWPRDGFMGNIFSVITGKGAPTIQELAVLERYLGSTAGI